MSGNNNHMTTWSSSDIQKYLKGELTATEMHALEAAALDDPFLADALEGMTLHTQLPDQPSWNEDLATLQSSLDEKIAPRKDRQKSTIRRIGWRIAAAAAILVAVSVSAIYFLSNNTSSTEAAIATTQQSARLADSTASISAAPPSGDIPTTASPSATTTSPAAADRDIAANENKPLPSRQIIASNAKRSTIANRKQTIQPNQFIAQPGLAVGPTQNFEDLQKTQDKDIALHNGTGIKLDTLAPNLSAPNLTDLKASPPINPTDNKNLAAVRVMPGGIPSGPSSGNIQGRVTDINNNAVANASVLYKNTNPTYNFSTVTDKDGKYDFSVKNLDTTSRLDVASVGYSNTSVALTPDNRTNKIIQLRPQQSSLNEVVVTGYGTKRKETLRRNIDAPAIPLSTTALPNDGWDLYNHYLDNNKKSPALDPSLIGNETISFIVNKKGSLSSFKVERSISAAHDSVTIHLIKTGPAWKLMKGRNARAVVTVSFP